MILRGSIPAQAFMAYVPVSLLGHIVQLSNDVFALKVLDQVWVCSGIILPVELSGFVLQSIDINIPTCYEISLIVDPLFKLLEVCR